MADTLIASGILSQDQTRLSLANSYAFTDLLGVNLGLYLGSKLVVWDSAMRPASAYPVTSGTGETYGPQIFTDPGFAVPGDWTVQAGVVVGSGVATWDGTGASATLYQTLASSVGSLFLFNFDIKTRTAGSLRLYAESDIINAVGYSAVQDNYAVYATAYGSGSPGLFGIRSNGNNFTGTVDNLNAYKVLTPSIMGVIVSSNPSGTPGDAWSIAPNFNYNDTAGYTWAILSESSSIMYSFPEDKTQIDRRPRNKVYNEPFASFQSPGSAPRLVYPVLVDDIRKHTNLKAFSRAYYEPWGQFQPPVSAPRLPLTADVSDKTAHTNRKVPRAYFDFASKAPTQKDGNINPSPQASGRYRGWASNWAIGVKEDFPWS